MKKIKIYDLPTRIFHWLFAVLFISSYFIAETIDDDSVLYSYHMLLGMVMMAVVILRIIWGFCGSPYARFSSFELNPRALFNYFSSMLGTKTRRYVGHNPASSWAALAMMFFGIGLGVTGILMSKKVSKDFFEDIHELMADGFLITVIAHIAGILFHQFKHRDRIGMSMISGEKVKVDEEAQATKSHYGAAFIFTVTVGIFVFYLNSNFIQETRSLDLFGTNIQLGDNEHKKHHDSHRKSHKKGDHDKHNDDD